MVAGEFMIHGTDSTIHIVLSPQKSLEMIAGGMSPGKIGWRKDYSKAGAEGSTPIGRNVGIVKILIHAVVVYDRH